jgi:tetratricopeptide (TPR) repeat protein
LAHYHLRQQRPNHALQTTALVHEAYLKLSQEKFLRVENHAHFLGIAVQLMRWILVDYEPSRHAAKRGAGVTRSLAFRTRSCVRREGTGCDGRSRAKNSKKCTADLEFSFFFNKAQTFLDLATNVLDVRISTAKGDHEAAIKYGEQAVQIEDKLNYGEPPEWFYPVRESLGAALLLNGQPDRAEAVFRADLEQYPRNPRSLFGLLKSLEAQRKSSSVEEVRREFEAAWEKTQTCQSRSETCKLLSPC